MFSYMKKNHAAKAGSRLCEEVILLKRDFFYLCSSQTGWFFETFTIIHICKLYKQVFDFFETCFTNLLAEATMQSTGEKQQFLWTNEMMDASIISLENFKALMEFKGKYFDGDRQAQ